jgi:hypothetical protein
MARTEKRPFIPRDKPKSFVVFTLAGFTGLAAGLLAFALGWAGFDIAFAIARALFVVCWFVGALFLLVFFVQTILGVYKDLEPKPWREQKW